MSICFFRDNWRPDSFYPKIAANVANNFHTLCLLDIKVKEQSFENMAKGLAIYEQPRYMTINQCIDQLLEVEDKRKEKVYTEDSKAFGVARLGQGNQQIVSGTLKELLAIDFGGPLHSLVLAAPQLHDIEEAMWEYWHWDRTARRQEQQVRKAEREAREKQEEAERRQKIEEAEKNNPTVMRSSVPKVKAPVKASATAPSLKKEESEDEEDGVVMEPLF